MKKIIIVLMTFPTVYLLIALTLVFLPIARQIPIEGLNFDDLPRIAGTLVSNMQEKFYTARDGSQLFYRHFPGKKGFNLVLLHGSGTDGRYLLPLGKALNDSGLSIYIPDLRGHGRSKLSHPGDVTYVGQLEHDLEDLRTQIRDNSRMTMLAGHSSGGGLVVRYGGIRRGIGEYDGYIMMTPYLGYQAPTVRPDSGGWVQVANRRYTGLVMLNNIGITIFNDKPVLFFNRPEKWNDSLQIDSYSYRMNESFAPRSYKDDLQNNNYPMLAFAGEKDEAFYAEKFEQVFNEYAPNLEFHLIKDAGHLDIVSHQKVIDEIIKWMDD